MARLRLLGLRRRGRASTSGRTRPGLEVRAVGESPAAADAMGISVTRYRYLHTLAGGALAGVGGACFSLALTPQWVDGLTAGAGWIAIALVIFAFWRPDLCLVGAYAFGAFSALPLILQARGVTVAPQVFQSLPYVMTIVVLVLVSHRERPAAARRACRARDALRAGGALSQPRRRPAGERPPAASSRAGDVSTDARRSATASAGLVRPDRVDDLAALVEEARALLRRSSRFCT